MSTHPASTSAAPSPHAPPAAPSPNAPPAAPSTGATTAAAESGALLSVPIYILKQQAKALARQQKVPLHQALNQLAVREGFKAWSHLASRWARQAAGTAGRGAADGTRALAADPQAAQLLARLPAAGGLLLLGARPGQGKTLLALALAVQAMQRGRHAAFFTLDFTRADVVRCFAVLGHDLQAFAAGGQFLFDDAEHLNAAHIAARLAATPPHTLVVVDYLQLLDQRRENPSLAHQVQQLRRFALERQAHVVCLSQISRHFQPSPLQPQPGLGDVRLPNPLDLALFDQACFLSGGKMRWQTAPDTPSPEPQG